MSSRWRVKNTKDICNSTLPDVNYGNSLDEIQKAAILMNIHFKSTNVHIIACGILIERNWLGFIVTFNSYLTKKQKEKHTTNQAQMSFICHIHNYTEYNEK